MNIVVDVSAVPANPAGAGRYIVELARSLAARGDVELTLISRHRDAARWFAPNTLVVPAVPNRRPIRLAWEQLFLPRRLRALGGDVFHGPHYTMPERARLPRVVTIHDLTFFDHPEWHERAKVPFFRRAITVAARRADAIVCVSATTAQRLGERIPTTVPIHVIPHGVDHDRFRPEEPVAGHDLSVLSGLGVHPPYVAFVGTVEPRKDVPSLVRAFDRVAGRHPSLSLVIAGTVGWGEEELTRAVGRMAHRDRVIRTGFVADDAVAALLRQAAAVAYPSLEEGFGLPALEALACGGPLVTTTGTAMAEVASGAALLVPPGDVDALAEALDELVVGGPEVARRRGDGLLTAARYNWEATAEGHVDVYRSVTGQ